MAGTLPDHMRRCIICNRLPTEIEHRFGNVPATAKIVSYAFGIKPTLMTEEWDEIPNPAYIQIDICRSDLNLMKRIQSKYKRAGKNLTTEQLIEFTWKHRARLNDAA